MNKPQKRANDVTCVGMIQQKYNTQTCSAEMLFRTTSLAPACTYAIQATGQFEVKDGAEARHGTEKFLALYLVTTGLGLIIPL